MGHGNYGVKGAGTSDGSATLNKYAPGAIFTQNAIVGGGSCTQYPAGNTCPTTMSGATVGADMAKVLAATRGAVVVDALSARRRVPRPGELTTPWKPSPPECQKIGTVPAYCDRPIQK